MDPAQDEARPLVQLKAILLTALLAMGALFAYPANAQYATLSDTSMDISVSTANMGFCSYPGICYNATNLYYFDTAKDVCKIEVAIGRVKLGSFDGTGVDGYLQLKNTTTGIEIASSTFDIPPTLCDLDLSLTPPACSQWPIVTFEFDECWTFPAGTSTLTVIENGSYSAIDLTLNAGPDQTWDGPFREVPAGWGTYYSEFQAILYGGNTSSTAPTETEIPSSTYDGTYSEYLPTVGFSSNTLVSTGGEYEDTMNEIFGTTTWAGFPMCFVSPWFQLIDILNGATKNDQPTKSIIIGHGISASTTSIDLESASTTFAGIGLKNVTDILIPFFEAVCWLLFGLVVWKDIMNSEEGDID